MLESSFSHLFVAVFSSYFVSNAKKIIHSFIKQVCFEKKATYVLVGLFNSVPFLPLLYANISMAACLIVTS